MDIWIDRQAASRQQIPTQLPGFRYNRMGDRCRSRAQHKTAEAQHSLDRDFSIQNEISQGPQFGEDLHFDKIDSTFMQ